MRASYVHCASVVVADSEAQAPGAAVTIALCGHWEHDPPCPLAPHHTSSERCGGLLDLRVVFVSEVHNEAEVRQRIISALHAGHAEALEGVQWELVSEAVGTLTAAEAAVAARWTTPRCP